MNDLWAQSTLEIDVDPGNWRCIVDGQTLGPLTLENLVSKLLQGEIDEATPVSREDSAFAPLAEVAVLAKHIPTARVARGQRLRRRAWRRKVLLGSLAGGLLVVAIALSLQAVHRREAAQQMEIAAQKARLAQQAQEQAAAVAAATAAEAAAVPMELVPIVSLESPKDVHFPAPPRRAKAPKRAAPSEVQTCQLTQQMVYSTLRRGLGAINHCVVLAKRGPQQRLLPPRLELSFVVQPRGQVVDFELTETALQRGPLRDCLARAFGNLRFPVTHGVSCPVTLPLRVKG